jgi:hypothetical protein
VSNQPGSEEAKAKLVMAKPPKSPSEMTDQEIEEWAESIADGLNPYK